MFEAVTRAQRSAELFTALCCCLDSSKVRETCEHASPSHSEAAGWKDAGPCANASGPPCNDGANAANPASTANNAAVRSLNRLLCLVIVPNLLLSFGSKLPRPRAAGRSAHFTLALSCSKCCALILAPIARGGLAG